MHDCVTKAILGYLLMGLENILNYKFNDSRKRIKESVNDFNRVRSFIHRLTT